MSLEEEAKKRITEKEKEKEKEGNYIGKAKIIKLPLDDEPASRLGYKAIDPKYMPSLSYFYPDDLKIAIRPALIGEIKHWSTIEESDPISVDTSLNFIMERCVRLTSKKKLVSFKDLKEIDRLYLLFAVREISFKKGQNALKAEYYNSNDKLKTVELTKDMISYFKMPEDFSEFYSHEKRGFVFANPDDPNETCEIFFPSIGVSQAIDTWAKGMREKRRNVEKDFVTYAQFLINDFRELTDKRIKELRIESGNWSLWKISLLSFVTETLEHLVNPTMTIKKDNGTEDIMPLNFQGGLKAIFIIPDPLGRHRRN